MATIAKQALEIITPKKGQFVTLDAAGTIKRGELVGFTSGEYSALSGSDPALGVIAGIALHDAVAADKLTVFQPDKDAVFAGNLGGTSVTAESDQGVKYGLVEASDLVHVDKTDTTNVRVVVVQLDKRDAVGDTNGRVQFRFLRGATIWDQAAA